MKIPTISISKHSTTRFAMDNINKHYLWLSSIAICWEVVNLCKGTKNTPKKTW